MKTVKDELQNIYIKLAEADTERDFQTVGTLCREALITLGQTVYEPSKHGHIGEIETSKADTSRMLEAYIKSELEGSTYKEMRKVIRESLNLINQLQHKRTADFKHAAICLEMTSALVNSIAIISEDTVQGDYGLGTRVELSENAAKLTELLNTNSEKAFHHDPEYRLSEIMEKLSITKDECEEVIDELEELGLINVHRSLSDQLISPANSLFLNTDHVFQGWNPLLDAKTIARAIVRDFQGGTIETKTVDEVLEWGPRRFNPAITYLVENGIVDSSETLNPGPYKYLWVMVTAKTRRYARE